MKFEGGWASQNKKKKFPETVTQKMFETNSSFYVN